MKLGDRLKGVSPWTVLAVAGCAVLVLVDYWREQAPGTFPLIQGTLPNLIAVPTLTFGFLMLRFPERRPHIPADAVRQKTYFWVLWVMTTLATVIWEFTQLAGNLVFDPLDLAATLIGAAATIPVFRILIRYSFLGET